MIYNSYVSPKLIFYGITNIWLYPLWDFEHKMTRLDQRITN